MAYEGILGSAWLDDVLYGVWLDDVLYGVWLDVVRAISTRYTSLVSKTLGKKRG